MFFFVFSAHLCKRTPTFSSIMTYFVCFTFHMTSLRYSSAISFSSSLFQSQLERVFFIFFWITKTSSTEFHYNHDHDVLLLIKSLPHSTTIISCTYANCGLREALMMGVCWVRESEWEKCLCISISPTRSSEEKLNCISKRKLQMIFLSRALAHRSISFFFRLPLKSATQTQDPLKLVD